MSFIQRDSLSPQVATTAMCSRMYHRFDKAWPKSGGYYNDKLYFYFGGQYQKTRALEWFLKSFGITWESFSKEEVDKEVESMWFYLKPEYSWDGSYALIDDGNDSARASRTGSFPSSTTIANTFNQSFRIPDPELPPYPTRTPEMTDEEFKVLTDEWDLIKENRLDDMEIEVTIHYGLNQRYLTEHELSWQIDDTGVIRSGGFNAEYIQATIEAHPWYYLANARSIENLDDSAPFQAYDGAGDTYDMPKNQARSKNTPFMSACNATVTIIDTEERMVDTVYLNPGLGIFAMMDNGVTFEPIGEPYYIRYSTTSTDEYSGETMNYSYKRKFKYRGINSSSSIIQNMQKYFAAHNSQLGITHNINLVDTQRKKIEANISTTTYTKMLNNMRGGASNGTVPLFSGNRLNSETARRMKRRDFAELVGNCIETDHKIKDAEWWEKIVAVVIIIVAIVAAIFFAPAGALALIALGDMAAVAGVLGTAALVLMVGGMALSYFGGASAAGLVKLIGNIAQIVGIAAMITGVYAAIQQAGKIAIKEAAKAAGKTLTEKQVIAELAKRSFAENATAFVTQAIDSVVTKLTEFVSMDFLQQADFVFDSLDFIQKGMKFFQDDNQAELQAEYEAAQEEDDKYNKEVLSNSLKNPAAVQVMMEERLTSYDAITEIQIVLDSLVGKDKNYQAWDTNVNSV